MSLFAELKRRNVVRVVLAYLAGAWLLIQVADTVFPAFGLPESSLAILITLLVIGLIPAVVVSWAFQLTPDGLRRDAEIAPSESIAPQTGRKLDRVIMLVLALAVGYFIFDELVIEKPVPLDSSIAVLPFADMSPDGDQAYLSDGLPEEILNLLAQVRELRVISRSSAFQYRGEVHVPTVAAELNVSYVLEGSVRKAGERIRVTAQLIDARADAHVWSKNFDRDLADIFAIQDEIAKAIVDDLQVRLTGDAPRSFRTDPETHALYLQARHLIHIEQGSFDIAEKLLQQALGRDRDYLPALNLMVTATFNITGDSQDDRYTFEEGISRMRGYVDRALAIDPRNSDALAHRSWMAFWYGNDLETAVEYLNQALRNDPANEWALYVAMVTSLRIGRSDDTIALAEVILDRDPLCSGCLYNLMNAATRAGRYDEALAASERRMRVATGGWVSRGDIYLLMGDARKALELYERQPDLIYTPRGRAIAFHELGDFEARDKAMTELARVDEHAAYLEMANAQAWIGNNDAAFEWLDRYLDADRPNFAQDASRVLWSPFLRNLHADERWHALREKANMTEERLSKIRIELP